MSISKKKKKKTEISIIFFFFNNPPFVKGAQGQKGALHFPIPVLSSQPCKVGLVGQVISPLVRMCVVMVVGESAEKSNS